MDRAVRGRVLQPSMNIQGVGEVTYTLVFDEIVEPDRIAWHVQFAR